MLKLPYYINGGGKMKRCERMILSRPSTTPVDMAVFKK